MLHTGVLQIMYPHLRHLALRVLYAQYADMSVPHATLYCLQV